MGHTSGAFKKSEKLILTKFTKILLKTIIALTCQPPGEKQHYQKKIIILEKS